MARTFIACACMAWLAYAAATWITGDFTAWTAEGARRAEVETSPVAAPLVTVLGPDLEPGPLAGLLADGAGVTVVDFIYTRCNTVCSALGTGFQQMQSAILSGDAAEAGALHGRIRLLSISFDSGHDDVQALAAYAARLQADPRIWRFARVPDAEELRRLLKAFQVVVIPDGLGGFQHNAGLMLVDRSGRLVRIFDYAQLEEALAAARALASPGGAA